MSLKLRRPSNGYCYKGRLTTRDESEERGQRKNNTLPIQFVFGVREISAHFTLEENEWRSLS